MTYITRSDLDARWGADNITAWAKRSGATTAAQVTTVIDTAIAEAEAEVESGFIGTMYAVPLTGNSAHSLAPLKRAMVDIAAQILAGPADKEDEVLQDAEGRSPREAAQQLMNSYLSGSRRLDAVRTVTGAFAPRGIVDSGGAVDGVDGCGCTGIFNPD